MHTLRRIAYLLCCAITVGFLIGVAVIVALATVMAMLPNLS